MTAPLPPKRPLLSIRTPLPPSASASSAAPSELVAKEDAAARLIPLDRIDPRADQPRRHFDGPAQAELTASVRRHGVLQPLLLRPVGERFEIVAGERRFRAASAAGLTSVPAVVRAMDEEQARAIALIENLQRRDLNAYEETEGLLDLLALRLNRSRAVVVALLYALDHARRKRTDNVVGKGSAPYFPTPEGRTDNVVGRGDAPSSSAPEGRTDNVVGTTDEETKGMVERSFGEIGRMSLESFVAHRLPLLKLPADVIERLRTGRLDYTKARLVAREADPTHRAELLDLAETASLSELRARMRGAPSGAEGTASGAEGMPVSGVAAAPFGAEGAPVSAEAASSSPSSGPTPPDDGILERLARLRRVHWAGLPEKRRAQALVLLARLEGLAR